MLEQAFGNKMRQQQKKEFFFWQELSERDNKKGNKENIINCVELSFHLISQRPPLQQVSKVKK